MSYPQTAISDIANFINGFPFKPSDWCDKGYKIIRIQNLSNLSKPFNRTQKEVPTRYLVKRGDILVSWSATIDVFEWDDEDSYLNQHIFKVEYNPQKVDKQYFKLSLKNTIRELGKFAHGSTMKHVVKGDFDNHQIPLPPLDDQIRIATLLSKVENLISRRREQLKQLGELLKSVFLEMFGDPVRNDMGWETVPLAKFGSLDRGVSKHRPRNAPELLGGKYPLIQTGEVSNAGTYITSYTQTYSDAGFKQSKMWKKGTLCITIAANIAKTGILTFDACFPDSVVGFTVNPNEANILFVHHLFAFFQKILETKAPQAAQKNINLEMLRTLIVPKPSLDIQNQFSIIVTKVESLKTSYAQSLIQLESLYGTISQKAFRGELDLSRVPLVEEGEPVI